MNPLHNIFCSSSKYETAMRERLFPAVLSGLDLSSADVLEIGPGFGAGTQWLTERAGSVTAVEYEAKLAEKVRRRVPKATVIHGSGTAMPLEDASYDVVVCTTMLHHVPTDEDQDALLGEARRVLRPGGTFCGSDSRESFLFRLAHIGDVMNVVDPQSFGQRLVNAGCREPKVTVADRAFLFRATA
ncbi:MAG: class I SAM-dependent methyltransferase [Actinomycetes bacterium]